MSDILSNIKKIQNSFDIDIKKVSNPHEYETLKSSYLGRKGKIALLFKELSSLPKKEKKSSNSEKKKWKGKSFQNEQTYQGKDNIRMEQKKITRNNKQEDA